MIEPSNNEVVFLNNYTKCSVYNLTDFLIIFSIILLYYIINFQLLDDYLSPPLTV